MAKLSIKIETTHKDLDSKEEDPVKNSLYKELYTIFGQYDYFDALFDAFNNFLLSDGYNQNTILNYMKEWLEEKEEMFDNQVDDYLEEKKGER